MTECPDHVATTYGLVRDSTLNTLKYFHVTEGLPPDCMHDMLEGTIQYEIKELLKSLIAQGFFNLETVNSRIQLFPYSASDATNKPSTINTLSTSDHSLKQSGTMCLHCDSFCDLWQTVFLFSITDVVPGPLVAFDYRGSDTRG